MSLHQITSLVVWLNRVSWKDVGGHEAKGGRERRWTRGKVMDDIAEGDRKGEEMIEKGTKQDERRDWRRRYYTRILVDAGDSGRSRGGSRECAKEGLMVGEGERRERVESKRRKARQK